MIKKRELLYLENRILSNEINDLEIIQGRLLGAYVELTLTLKG